jgi:hypothetical protein
MFELGCNMLAGGNMSSCNMLEYVATCPATACLETALKIVKCCRQQHLKYIFKAEQKPLLKRVKIKTKKIFIDLLK